MAMFVNKRYHGAALLFWAAVFCACALASCGGALDGTIPEAKSGDMGNLRITISSGSSGPARTLLPQLNFTKYTVSFESEYTGVSHEDVELSGETPSADVTLERGQWTIRAVAYVGNSPAARGEVVVTINASAQTITIPVVNPASGTGTLKFSVAGPPSTTFIYALKRPDDESVVTGDTLLGGVEDEGITAGSGVYFFTVEARYDGKTIKRIEAVHIYPNLETTAVYSFTRADFGLLQTLSGTVEDVLVNGARSAVTKVFAYSDEDCRDENEIGSGDVEWGASGGTWTIAVNTFNGSSTVYFKVRADPNDDGNYYEISAGSTPAPLDNESGISLGTIIFKGEAGAEIITVDDENNITLESTYTMPLSKAAGSSFTLTVKPDGMTDIRWFIDGVQKTAVDNYPDITISAADYDVGVHYLTVIVWKNGAPYSPDQDIRFRVTDEGREQAENVSGNDGIQGGRE
jgi:hypothetical protein